MESMELEIEDEVDAEKQMVRKIKMVLIDQCKLNSVYFKVDSMWYILKKSKRDENLLRSYRKLQYYSKLV